MSESSLLQQVIGYQQVVDYLSELECSFSHISTRIKRALAPRVRVAFRIWLQTVMQAFCLTWTQLVQRYHIATATFLVACKAFTRQFVPFSIHMRRTPDGRLSFDAGAFRQYVTIYVNTVCIYILYFKTSYKPSPRSLVCRLEMGEKWTQYTYTTYGIFKSNINVKRCCHARDFSLAEMISWAES